MLLVKRVRAVHIVPFISIFLHYVQIIVADMTITILSIDGGGVHFLEKQLPSKIIIIIRADPQNQVAYFHLLSL